MKKFLILILMFLCSSATFAGPYDGFNYFLNFQTKDNAKKYLEYLADDVGQAIGGGAQGVGGILDLGGLNLSLKVSYQNVSDDDLIVRCTGDKSIYYPIIQGEFAIIKKLSALARVSYANDSVLIGAGGRVLVYESYEPVIPSVTIQSVYNYLKTDANKGNKFNAWNLKTSITGSFFEVPYVKPYIFLSYDITQLTAKSSIHDGLTANAYGFGYGAGLSAALDILNLSFTLSMYNGQPNYNFGIFIAI